MAGNMGKYSSPEDQLLCECYIQISEDPEIGRYQPRNTFWGRVTEQYNSKAVGMGYPTRPQRSVECRMGTILTSMGKFKAAYEQVERLHPSGANEIDILTQARILYKDDPKNTKGPFKFDHIWETMRHLEKYETVSRKPRREANMSQSYEMPESPISPNPDLSSFTINLSEENTSGGSSSSLARPEGSKKSKLKRKVGDNVCSALNALQGENEKFREMMMQNNLKREQSTELLMQKREAEKEKAAIRRQMAEAHKQLADTNTWTEENKILMIDLDTISNFTRREYFRKEQERIIQKREMQSQQPPNNNMFNAFGGYFPDIGGSGTDLGDY